MTLALALAITTLAFPLVIAFAIAFLLLLRPDASLGDAADALARVLHRRR